jgi:hypothetical protein
MGNDGNLSGCENGSGRGGVWLVKSVKGNSTGNNRRGDRAWAKAETTAKLLRPRQPVLDIL